MLWKLGYCFASVVTRLFDTTVLQSYSTMKVTVLIGCLLLNWTRGLLKIPFQRMSPQCRCYLLCTAHVEQTISSKFKTCFTRFLCCIIWKYCLILRINLEQILSISTEKDWQQQKKLKNDSACWFHLYIQIFLKNRTLCCVTLCYVQFSNLEKGIRATLAQKWALQCWEKDNSQPEAVFNQLMQMLSLHFKSLKKIYLWKVCNYCQEMWSLLCLLLSEIKDPLFQK